MSVERIGPGDAEKRRWIIYHYDQKDLQRHKKSSEVFLSGKNMRCQDRGKKG